MAEAAATSEEDDEEYWKEAELMPELVAMFGQTEGYFEKHADDEQPEEEETGKVPAVEAVQKFPVQHLHVHDCALAVPSSTASKRERSIAESILRAPPIFIGVADLVARPPEQMRPTPGVSSSRKVGTCAPWQAPCSSAHGAAGIGYVGHAGSHRAPARIRGSHRVTLSSSR
jgi:hypothetical protein